MNSDAEFFVPMLHAITLPEGFHYIDNMFIWRYK